ncbi:hypothetical protein JOF53_001278 [Crossiella equi]|uniref:Uncharacterized protein n=1 Tax=Crossiella equi TaxID=130796 RepID=A0ABS5A771_9PSEU|nr:hypothetical protein [Crossiella equi]MBP2472406.1 hypothetical protein [Crossiella equi]
MTALLAPTATNTGASLVSPDLFARLVGRLVRKEGMTQAGAEAIMADALAFLNACAQPHQRRLSPSAKVDLGWHPFILDTKEYERFCHTLAGRFLHHVPIDPAASGEEDDEESAAAALARTVEAIQETGLTVHPELWPLAEAIACRKCSQCHNGCSDDPPPSPRRR